MLKLKMPCGKEIAFGVTAKAQDGVKALKQGCKVEVTYIKCPKSGRLMVTAVKACGSEQCADCNKGALTGTVVAVCPQGKMLKLKMPCGKEITLGVTAAACDKVKALKQGTQVTVKSVTCPKTGKLMTTSVEPCAAEPSAAPEKGTITGTVAAVCPQGKMLKLKMPCGKEITLGVTAAACDKVKALKQGAKVTVDCVKCPKSKRLMIKEVR